MSERERGERREGEGESQRVIFLTVDTVTIQF